MSSPSPPLPEGEEAGEGGSAAKERGSRVLPLFVSAFAVAVLVGVLYLAWLMLGMG